MLKMARAVYVDTSPTAINGKREKPHYVYDDEKIYKVSKLTKLKGVDEVFIDTLFPEIYEEILELLKKNVKVYLVVFFEFSEAINLEEYILIWVIGYML